MKMSKLFKECQLRIPIHQIFNYRMLIPHQQLQTQTIVDIERTISGQAWNANYVFITHKHTDKVWHLHGWFWLLSVFRSNWFSSNTTDLSNDMHTSMKLDKYSPKVRKNIMIRHIASPAVHWTVKAQPISSGINRNVTWNTNNCHNRLNSYKCAHEKIDGPEGRFHMAKASHKSLFNKRFATWHP